MADLYIKPVRIAIQIAVCLLFITILGYFSTYPRYHQLSEHEAVLKLSFSHSGQLKFKCQPIDPSDFSKLQPNMRKIMDCPRELALVRVEIDMDQKVLYRVITSPLGLQKDGLATVYRSTSIPAGFHHFSARMSDSADGVIHYVKDVDIDLQPGQVLLIDFVTGSGGFVFSGG